MKVGWKDEYLVWKDEYPYNCVEEIHVMSEHFWLPDIALSNGRDNVYSTMMMSNMRTRLKSNGETMHGPVGVFAVFCDLNLTNFPFDSQICSLRFRNWQIPSELQHFTLYETETVSAFKLTGIDSIKHPLWVVSDLKARIEEKRRTTNRQQVSFEFKMSRRPLFYCVNFVLPTIILSLVQLSTFSIPHKNPEKLQLSLTCLLAYSVFQTSVVRDLPKTSDNTPFLLVYIAIQPIFIAVSILAEAVVIFMTTNKDLKVRFFIFLK